MPPQKQLDGMHVLLLSFSPLKNVTIRLIRRFGMIR